MRDETPLACFLGIAPDRYLALWPVSVVTDDPAALEFRLRSRVVTGEAFPLGDGERRPQRAFRFHETPGAVEPVAFAAHRFLPCRGRGRRRGARSVSPAPRGRRGTTPGRGSPRRRPARTRPRSTGPRTNAGSPTKRRTATGSSASTSSARTPPRTASAPRWKSASASTPPATAPPSPIPKPIGRTTHLP